MHVFAHRCGRQRGRIKKMRLMCQKVARGSCRVSVWMVEGKVLLYGVWCLQGDALLEWQWGWNGKKYIYAKHRCADNIHAQTCLKMRMRWVMSANLTQASFIHIHTLALQSFLWFMRFINARGKNSGQSSQDTDQCGAALHHQNTNEAINLHRDSKKVYIYIHIFIWSIVDS